MIRSCLALLVVPLLLLAPGCNTAENVAKTPAQRVFAVQADYNAALNLALAYESLPRCSAAITSGCSQPAVVTELRRADNVAYSAIKAAQDTVRTPGASNSTIELVMTGAANAVGVFRTVLRTYNIGSR